MFETLLDETNTCRDVYADRGYAKVIREEALREWGYRDRIQRKGQAGKPLSKAHRRRNQGIASQQAQRLVEPSEQLPLMSRDAHRDDAIGQGLVANGRSANTRSRA